MSERRDFETDPYDKSEQRVAEFFSQFGLGGGDDPIGVLLASHELFASERNKYLEALKIIHRSATHYPETCGQYCLVIARKALT